MYYLIELNEVDKDKWKLLDEQVRQILFTHFRSVFLDPLPLRYTVWEDDDVYFGGTQYRSPTHVFQPTGPLASVQS